MKNKSKGAPKLPAPSTPVGGAVPGIVAPPRQRKPIKPSQVFLALVGLILGGAVAYATVPVLPMPAPLVLAALPLFVFLGIAFGSAGGRPMLSWVPIFFGALLGRKRWFVRVPILTGTPTPPKQIPTPPRALQNMQLVDVPVGWARRGRLGGVGVIFDARSLMCSAVLPVLQAGGDLSQPDERSRLVAYWNHILTQLFNERTNIAHITWSERVTQPLVRLEIPIGDNGEVRVVDPTDVIWPLDPAREVVISVSIDASKVPPTTRVGDDPQQAAIAALMEEVRHVAHRLSGGGITVGPPLSPGELARLMRVRCDPSVDLDPARRRALSLAERAAVVSPDDAPPDFQDEHWNYLQIREAFHRTYWVAEWPPMGDATRPDVLHAIDVVQYAAHGVQTVTFTYEPDRPPVDEASPFMRPASGIRYLATVTLASPSIEHLGVQATEYEEDSIAAGFELRPLEGRHDQGWVASLPLGRTLGS